MVPSPAARSEVEAQTVLAPKPSGDQASAGEQAAIDNGTDEGATDYHHRSLDSVLARAGSRSSTVQPGGNYLGSSSGNVVPTNEGPRHPFSIMMGPPPATGNSLDVPDDFPSMFNILGPQVPSNQASSLVPGGTFEIMNPVWSSQPPPLNPLAASGLSQAPESYIPMHSFDAYFLTTAPFFPIAARHRVFGHVSREAMNAIDWEEAQWARYHTPEGKARIARELREYRASLPCARTRKMGSDGKTGVGKGSQKKKTGNLLGLKKRRTLTRGTKSKA